MDLQTLAAAIAVAKRLNNTEQYVAAEVASWLDEHIDPTTGYAVDDTLSVSGAAADAAAVGKKFALAQPYRNEISGGDVAYGAKLTSVNSTPIADALYNTSDYIAVTGGETLICSTFTRYWFYDNSKTALDTGNLNGKTTYLIDGNTDIKTLSVPSTAAYIRVSFATANAALAFVCHVAPYEQKLDADIADTVELMKKTTTGLEWEQGGISPSVGTDLDRTTRIRLVRNVTSDGGILSIACADGYVAGIYGYNATSNEFRGTVKADGTYSKAASSMYWWSSYTFDFTKYTNTYFRVVLARSDDADISPTAGENATLTVYQWVDTAEAEDDYIVEQSRLLGLHTLPKSRGALNAVKRARQFTEIKWTPAVDLPRVLKLEADEDYGDLNYSYNDYAFQGTFKAGTQYQGIPYGRSDGYGDYGYSTLFVGTTIDFGTFLTAIENKESIVSKEAVYNKGGKSATVYGCSCTSMVCYALKIAYTAASNFANVTNLNYLCHVTDNGTEMDLKDLQVADVLVNTAVHVAMITDIIRDADGEVLAVEISEAQIRGAADIAHASDTEISGRCWRKLWLADDFFRNWKTFDIYRYAVFGNVTYTPSAYVNVGGETDAFRVEHLPIMPYEGEGFVYKTPSNVPDGAVKLVIENPGQGLGFLKVFRDGNEITGSPFTVASDATLVTISDTTAGSYKAYLCNISDGAVTKQAAPCHWTINAAS